MRLGATTSIAGGISLAIGRAHADGGQCLQVFTRTARGWTSPPLAEAEAKAFRQESRAHGLPAIAHGSYLVNLATEDAVLRERSLSTVVEELRRCAALAIPCLVLHPGSHPDVRVGLRRVARAWTKYMPRQPGFLRAFAWKSPRARATASATDSSTWRKSSRSSRRRSGVGVCLDTCHLFAAGYDVSSARGMTAVLDEAIRRFGRRRIRCFHLNDSVGPLGCRRDRHAEIGRGMLGLAGFRALLNDERFLETPAVLETPRPDRYRATLRRLRALARAPSSKEARAPRKERSFAPATATHGVKPL